MPEGKAKHRESGSDDHMPVTRGTCKLCICCIMAKTKHLHLYPHPPMSSPPPCPSPPPGGGNRHCLVPKKTWRYHMSQDCATVPPGWLRLCPPPSFCPIALLRPLKMFPQGTIVPYVRSTGEPVLAVVQGPSPHGEQYRTITYKRGVAEVVHDRASLKRLTAVQTTSPPPRPYVCFPLLFHCS